MCLAQTVDLMSRWGAAMMVCLLLLAGCSSPPPPDMDGDGITDSEDADLDGDGYNNTVELDCMSDAWNTTSIQSEIDAISQRLTGRIKELAERYENTIGELNHQTSSLEEKVEGHLKKMGLKWN